MIPTYKHILTGGLCVVAAALFAENGNTGLAEPLPDAVTAANQIEQNQMPEGAVTVEEAEAAEMETGQEERSEPTFIDVPRDAVEGAVREEETGIPVLQAPLPGDEEVDLEVADREAEQEFSMSEDETISVDFPDEDVRTILRNVADLFDINLVIPETLQGRTSLKLRNVTWPQVFEVVLDPLEFTFVQDRNIIRIRAKSELAQEPVDTRVFIVNYARASELTASIQPLIDAAVGGRVQVDRRTNALVVTERPSRMPRILDIINRLDRPTSQVMIQSKFVEVRDTKGRDLGLDWSSLAEFGMQAGPFARDIEREVETGRTRERESIDTSSTTNTTTLGPSGFGFQNNTLGGTQNLLESGRTLDSTRNRLDTAVFSADQLSVVLNAIQQSSDVRLVSNPTVVTMDGETARIKITRDFPQPSFTFNAQTGQRQFNGLDDPIEVGITLDVVPTVNNDGFINMEVVPTVSSTQQSVIIEGTEFPIIDTREVNTRITLKDGFTLALGGLRDESESTTTRRVPFLSEVPALGRLFRTDSTSVENTDLIIFITARTLNPDGTTYEDVIDPRQLDAMRLTRADIPGYNVPEDERQSLSEIRDRMTEEAERRRLSRAEASLRNLAESEAEEESDDTPRRVIRGNFR